MILGLTNDIILGEGEGLYCSLVSTKLSLGYFLVLRGLISLKMGCSELTSESLLLPKSLSLLLARAISFVGVVFGWLLVLLLLRVGLLLLLLRSAA